MVMDIAATKEAKVEYVALVGYRVTQLAICTTVEKALHKAMEDGAYS